MRRAYIRYIARRVAQTLVTVFALATLVFIMVKTVPGDEARVAAGADASPQQIELVRQRPGLDQPLPVQYVRFLGRLAVGDLGTSITTFQPVSTDLSRVLPGTIELVIVAMIINLSFAIPAATLAAAMRGRAVDNTLRLLVVFAGGLPVFWVALVLQNLFGTVLGILPISGQNSFGMSPPVIVGMPTVDSLLAGNLSAFWDALQHLILPAFALALMMASQIFRTLRSALLGILESDFIAALRAKGASPTRILYRHAIPNGLNPVLTLAGAQLGIMIGSAVLVETVFARQGVGAYLAYAVAQKDTYAVLGSVLFVGVVVCLINLIVDILQVLIDPRIRSSQLLGKPA